MEKLSIKEEGNILSIIEQPYTANTIKSLMEVKSYDHVLHVRFLLGLSELSYNEVIALHDCALSLSLRKKIVSFLIDKAELSMLSAASILNTTLGSPIYDPEKISIESLYRQATKEEVGV